jgi:predicted transglutaminase-like cysteine proteinase
MTRPSIYPGAGSTGVIPISTYVYPTNPNDTDVSTADTIKVIKDLAKEYSSSVCITQAVNDATRNLSNYSKDRVIVRCVYYWIRKRIKFITDEENEEGYFKNPIHPLGSEVLVCPDLLLKTGMGDCDDFSLLLGAMLLNLGFMIKFVTVAADRNDPNKFSHIFLKTFLADEGSWIHLDASHGCLPGWRATDYYRIQEW